MTILALLTFISEIFLWVGAGRWVSLLFKQNRTLSTVFAVIAVVLLIVIWGLFFSPKARYRLPKLPRILSIISMSLVIGFGLYLQGEITFGLIVLIGVTIVQAVGQALIYEN